MVQILEVSILDSGKGHMGRVLEEHSLTKAAREWWPYVSF